MLRGRGDQARVCKGWNCWEPGADPEAEPELSSKAAKTAELPAGSRSQRQAGGDGWERL